MTQRTFTNPLLPVGPDPYATFHDGYYCVMVTEQHHLALRSTADITRLADADYRIVWTPGSDPRCMICIWAPELHRIAGRWHIYFTANTADDNDRNRRLFVLGCLGDDPFADDWEYLGPLALPFDCYAIDGTVLHDDGKDYFLWSSKRDLRGGWWQHIMIAPLETPTRLGAETILSLPEYDWECDQQPTNEGPQILRHGRDIWVAYSASAFWSPCYALGFLQARSGTNLCDARNWRKHDHPFFSQSPEAGVYGPGHNSFVQSPDGTEDWILYHARDVAQDSGGRDTRSPRLQRISWHSDGTPDLGKPLATSTQIPLPSGLRD